MASLKSRAFNVFLRIIRKKHFLKKQFDFGRFDFYNAPEPPPEIAELCAVEKRSNGSRNIFVLRPKKGSSTKHILYLHGGAYVQNFVKQHWTFLGGLVHSLHCSITAPDYPLAPKHTFRDSFDMVVPLYREMVAAHPPADVILMGDSAGGGFALALALHLRTLGLPQPSKIFLFSPWLDLTLENPAIEKIDPTDPFLGVAGLRKAGIAYAGGADRKHYMLSPINGTFEGLADVYLFIGSRDVLVADARELKVRMAAQNHKLHYYEYEDMIHVWMFLNFEESRAARGEIIRLIGDEGVAV